MRAIMLLALLIAPTLAEAAPLICAGNSESSTNFGCANASNLAAMVADPADLQRGRESAGSDAVLEAAAIVRLRTNKVKKLRTNSTQRQQSTGAEE